MTLPFETLDVDADQAPSHGIRVRTLRKLAEAADAGFWSSLWGQYQKYNRLSDRQWACVDREIERKAGPKSAPLAELKTQLADMVARFELAGEHVKRPAIILTDQDGTGGGDLRYQPAPEGRNTGWIYVKRRGITDWGTSGWVYIAKVNPETGDLIPAKGYEGRGRLIADIKAQLADGLDAAVLHYGLTTSNCGLCGRQLTEDLSVKSGVGPICAQRYNIDRTAMVQS